MLKCVKVCRKMLMKLKDIKLCLNSKDVERCLKILNGVKIY